MRWVVLLAASAIACARATLPVVVPEEVDRVVVLSLGASGEIVEGGGLRRVDAGALRFSAPGPALIVGWRGADLGELPREEVLASSTLRPASGCETALPAPRWAVRVDGEVHPLAAAELGGISLTGAWVADRCAPVNASALVSCGEGLEVCPIRSEVQEGCAFTLGLECITGPIKVKRTSDGFCAVTRGCAVTADGKLACTACPTCTEPDRYAGRDDCRFELDVAPPASLPAIARARVVAAPYRVARPGVDAAVDFDGIQQGYLHGIARVRRGPAERIAVAASGWSSGWHCGDDTASTVRFVDPETMAVSAPVPAPDCLGDLIADPLDEGRFLAFFGSSRRTSVGRFDADGALIGSVELVASSSAGILRGGLAATRSEIVAAYWLGTASVVLRLDPVTLAVTATRSIPGTVQDVEIASGQVALLDSQSDLVARYDLSFHACAGSSSYAHLRNPVSALGSLPPFDLLAWDAPERMLVAVGEYPAVHVLDDLCRRDPSPGSTCHASPGVCGPGLRALFSERAGEPVHLGRWSKRPGAVVVAGFARLGNELRNFEALAGFMSVASARFTRGTVSLGAGIAKDMVEDGRGRLWVTLPWAGEVVRLE